MVAKIKIKNALLTNFYYNENKVAQGVATCIAAENYPKSLEQLTQAGRLKMLQKIASLNENIKANSVHISLNFDPSEKLSDERLKEIAGTYMERIGFGQQPYLVYRHEDAGHPHIHILSVKVGLDGKGVDTHHIGLKKSEPARKAIEEQFQLVRAEDMLRQPYYLKPAYAQKIHYGKTESRRAIGNVLEAILKQYNYTSLAELNAVLRQYNVLADRCRETSRVYQNNGLLYRILDDNGKPVGVPIKASSFYNKPGLKFLEEHFKENAANRQPLKKHIKNAIDLYFIKQAKPSLDGLVNALEKQGIHTVLRQNETGFIYGVTYVDHKHKAVFNGSDLGKAYSAKAIQERCGLEMQAPTLRRDNRTETRRDTVQVQDSKEGAVVQKTMPAEKGSLETLMQSEHTFQPVPYELKKTRKKKKRKRLSDNNK